MGRLRRALRAFVDEWAGRRLVRATPPPVAPPVAPLPQGPVLAGRTALIVGAGPNIGRAVAVELAAAGAHIVLTNLAHELMAAARADVERLGGSCRCEVSDVSDPTASDRLVETLHRDGVVVDVLVLNAGTGGGVPEPPDLSPAAAERVFRTNVIGPLHLARRLTDDLARRPGGAIIVITSIHQRVPFGGPAYSASKAALGMVITELALAVAPRGVRVNGIAPGWVALDDAGVPLRHAPTLLHGTSIPPRYVGAAAVFLAAESLSGYTTGAVLAVDGGLSLHSYLTVPRGSWGA